MNDSPLIAVPEHAPVAEPKRIAVLASGRGTNFDRIVHACRAGEVTADVAGLVYNVAGAGCADVASRHGVESILVDHRAFADRTSFDSAVVDGLRGLQPDLVVMAGWMRIATPVLIGAFADRIINIHPSLLPAFRGLHAVRQALEAGVAIAGCSVHIVRQEVDGGPIVGQAAVPVLPGDDEEALHARIQEAEHLLYPRAIEAVLAHLGTRPGSAE